MTIKGALREAGLWILFVFIVVGAFLDKPVTWLLKATASTFVGLVVLSLLGVVHV